MSEGTSKRIRVKSRTTKRRVGTCVYRGQGHGQGGKRERGRRNAGGARPEEHRCYAEGGEEGGGRGCCETEAGGGWMDESHTYL